MVCARKKDAGADHAPLIFFSFLCDELPGLIRERFTSIDRWDIIKTEIKKT